ncbi:MAG: AAA family ATPase [Oscillospiraceae bacterium]|jgi:septum site-determining protein MinD|nr:AAA family ATPase [Oscillospiraceae bacterium]
MGRIIAVTSGKGGTGKTTSVAAIGACLAALGKKTLLLDCDVGLRNLDLALGMGDFAVADFTDVAEKGAMIDDAARIHPGIPGLAFLAAPAYRAPSDIDVAEVGEMLKQARARFDFVLLDSPAGIGPGFELAAREADMAIIVSVCDLSSIRDAEKTAEALRALDIEQLRLLINRVTARAVKALPMSVDDIIDAVGAQLIGVVRNDPKVPEAMSNDLPLVLFETKGACEDYLDTARRILGEDIPIY